LAPTKPKTKENNNQSEVRSVFTPLEIVLYNVGLDSSQALRLPPARGAGPTAPGPPRTRSASICQELHLNWTGDDLEALRNSKSALPRVQTRIHHRHLPACTVIERFGGTVPVILELPASADKCERQAWKRGVRRAYFETLKLLAGLFTHRHVEMEVLQRYILVFNFPRAPMG